LLLCLTHKGQLTLHHTFESYNVSEGGFVAAALLPLHLFGGDAMLNGTGGWVLMNFTTQ
jgi:hypothetical protein